MIGSNYYIMDAGLDEHVATRVQATRGALVLSCMLAFKRMLDWESLEPMFLQGIVPLCMKQVRPRFRTSWQPVSACYHVEACVLFSTGLDRSVRLLLT
jgi:hypothetical protein